LIDYWKESLVGTKIIKKLQTKEDRNMKLSEKEKMLKDYLDGN
jgi:hypothetical protein